MRLEEGEYACVHVCPILTYLDPSVGGRKVLLLHRLDHLTNIPHAQYSP